MLVNSIKAMSRILERFKLIRYEKLLSIDVLLDIGSCADRAAIGGRPVHPDCTAVRCPRGITSLSYHSQNLRAAPPTFVGEVMPGEQEKQVRVQGEFTARLRSSVEDWRRRVAEPQKQTKRQRANVKMQK
jgi:hypothetical protein